MYGKNRFMKNLIYRITKAGGKDTINQYKSHLIYCTDGPTGCLRNYRKSVIAYICIGKVASFAVYICGNIWNALYIVRKKPVYEEYITGYHLIYRRTKAGGKDTINQYKSHLIYCTDGPTGCLRNYRKSVIAYICIGKVASFAVYICGNIWNALYIVRKKPVYEEYITGYHLIYRRTTAGGKETINQYKSHLIYCTDGQPIIQG